MKKIYSTIVLLVFANLLAINFTYANESISKNKAGDIWIEPITGIEFLWIPSGCFMMGSQSGEPCEIPVHKVCLDGFWISRYEVTQLQWVKVMGTNPSEYKNCGWDCPVENISWNECQEFIKNLGDNFSLPTEAQWEYAARSGGRDELYSGSDTIDRVAWYSGNTKTKTQPVGRKDPNGFGIYDMSGNVWEWCHDWRGNYLPNEVKNPKGPSSGEYRVIRGGACFGDASWARTTNRGRFYPEFKYLLIGFRLVYQ